MGDALVTLRFGESLLDVECSQAKIPTDADNDDDIPRGYVRIEPVEEFVTSLSAGGAELPMVREGNTVLVSDEHVAMIQRED